MSQIINLGSGGSPAPGTYVETITGDLGGAVSPDLLGNINIITDNAGLGAGSTVLFLGTPINNTQTLVVTDVNNNTIMGADAGNLTLSGSSNTGFGYVSLAGLTSGSQNTAFGRSAGAANNSGSANTFVGFSAGANNTSASNNTSVGFEALRDNISGTNATAVGVGALRFSTANNNSAFGAGALQEVSGASGFGNTAVGSSALASLNTGQNNIAVGNNSLGGNFNGSYNIGIAGGLVNPFTGTESSNILLNNEGVVGVSNRLIIGRATGTAAHQLSTAYIHGINGNTVANTQMVTIDSVTSQLGTQAIPTGTISSLTGDVGPAVTPTLGNINVLSGLLTNRAGATVFFEGSGSDLLYENTDTVLGNTFIGNTVGSATTTGTNNVGLGNQNTLANITNGGNNVAIGVGTLPSLNTGGANIGIGTNAGFALTGGQFNVLIGNSNGGGITTSGANVALGYNAMAAGDTSNNTFVGFGAGFQSGSGGSNTALGYQALGNFPGGNNVAIGVNCMFNTPAATQNVIIGANAGQLITGSANVGIGINAMQNAGDANFNVAIGSNALATLGFTSNWNVAIGTNALQNLVNGNRNIAIGLNAGVTHNANESSCIYLNNDGFAGESNTLRIGAGTGTTGSELSTAYIHGINGNTVANTQMVTIDSVTSQLGTQAIPTPTSYTYTNVATTPYVVLTTDQYISVDSSGGARTIQLPNAATLGQSFIIKDRAGTADTNNITITTVGGVVTIDGATTYVMNTAYQSVQVIGSSLGYEIF